MLTSPTLATRSTTCRCPLKPPAAKVEEQPKKSIIFIYDLLLLACTMGNYEAVSVILYNNSDVNLRIVIQDVVYALDGYIAALDYSTRHNLNYFPIRTLLMSRMENDRYRGYQDYN